MTVFSHTVAEFVLVYVSVYLVTVVLYFALGFGIERLNRRNPGRRIQPGRRGEKRKGIEIRQSLASILVTSLSLSIGLFVQYKGWSWRPIEFGWWTAIPLFLLCMVLFDAWFYFAHRLLHTRPFYRFHALHHRSVAPTVWSNDSIGLTDTAISQGFYAAVVFVVPFPPAILIAHRLFDQVNGTFGHAGFEYFASARTRHPWPLLCTTYHDQHHAQFRYNFANYFSFWDRMMGTIAPNYDRRVETLQAAAPPLRLFGSGAPGDGQALVAGSRVPPAE